MIVAYLDRQHSGKPHAPGDRGAWGDFDQDGQVDWDETEATLTAQYLLAAELALRQRGIAVLPISDGSYAERHQRVCRYAALRPHDRHVYVAAHCNAGGGTYGAVFYDGRSYHGPRIAEAVARQLRQFVPELSAVQVLACSASTHTRVWETIRGVFPGKPFGICYEPGFLDQPAHAPLWTPQGLRLLGECLAFGIADWAANPA